VDRSRDNSAGNHAFCHKNGKKQLGLFEKKGTPNSIGLKHQFPQFFNVFHGHVLGYTPFFRGKFGRSA